MGVDPRLFLARSLEATPIAMADTKQDILDMLRELAELTMLEEGDPQSFRVRAYESAAQGVEAQSQRSRPVSPPRSSRRSTGSARARPPRSGSSSRRARCEKLEDLRGEAPARHRGAPANPGARAEGRQAPARGARRAIDRRPAPRPRRATSCARSRGSGRSRRTSWPSRSARLDAQGAVGRTPISVALPLATRILARLLEVPGVTHASYCGSLRRFAETIGDVDIVVAAERAGARDGGARRDERRRPRARPRRGEDERRDAPRDADRPARRRGPPARRRAPLLHRLEGPQHQAPHARARARLDAQRVRALRDRGRQGRRERDRGADLRGPRPRRGSRRCSARTPARSRPPRRGRFRGRSAT